MGTTRIQAIASMLRADRGRCQCGNEGSWDEQQYGSTGGNRIDLVYAGCDLHHTACGSPVPRAVYDLVASAATDAHQFVDEYLEAAEKAAENAARDHAANRRWAEHRARERAAKRLHGARWETYYWAVEPTDDDYAI